nr:MAG TPA: hypothetical protein [Caudoviricetes sp.]
MAREATTPCRGFHGCHFITHHDNFQSSIICVGKIMVSFFNITLTSRSKIKEPQSL